MNIVVLPTDLDVARAAADCVAGVLSSNPQLVMGLPTGRTPILLYRELRSRAAAGRVDFREVTTFNLDEFLGVAPARQGSYRQFMERHLFRHVDIDGSRIYFLDGSTSDPEGECQRYEEAIRAAGGIDLQVLGVGTNGHIGFNEPGAALSARTHRVRLRRSTRRANAALFGGRADLVPREALSMGMGTILSARQVLLLATGASKARVVYAMVRGDITTRCPASFLQLHPNATVMLDEPAAALLKRGVRGRESVGSRQEAGGTRH